MEISSHINFYNSAEIERLYNLENKIKMDMLVNTIMKMYKIDYEWHKLYAIDRLCYIYNLYNPDIYDIEHIISFKSFRLLPIIIKEPLNNQINYINSCGNCLNNIEVEKIMEFLLKEEYGYLFTHTKNKNWNIINIEANKINIENTYYSRKIDNEVIEKYKNYKLPVAVCIKEISGDINLLDGYHRLAASSEKEVPIILAS